MCPGLMQQTLVLDRYYVNKDKRCGIVSDRNNDDGPVAICPPHQAVRNGKCGDGTDREGFAEA